MWTTEGGYVAGKGHTTVGGTANRTGSLTCLQFVVDYSVVVSNDVMMQDVCEPLHRA